MRRPVNVMDNIKARQEPPTLDVVKAARVGGAIIKVTAFVNEGMYNEAREFLATLSKAEQEVIKTQVALLTQVML